VTRTGVQDDDAQRHVIATKTVDVADVREVVIDSQVGEETDLGVGTDRGDNGPVLEVATGRIVDGLTIHEEVLTLNELLQLTLSLVAFTMARLPTSPVSDALLRLMGFEEKLKAWSIFLNCVEKGG
jgi:hypothetical protein